MGPETGLADRRVMFISYNGMLDPLGQTQVLPYLRQLAKKGVRFTLLSFERAGAFTPEGAAQCEELRRELETQGIEWHHLRYHQRPSVPATIYDVLGVKPTKQVRGEDVAWRLTLMMVNEAARCFEEGILRTARDGDIGAIFGLGFPPFRGGPFRLIDALGVAEVVKRLEALQAQYGMRFEPAPLLREMARAGQTFHGERKVAPRPWSPAPSAVSAAR